MTSDNNTNSSNASFMIQHTDTKQCLLIVEQTGEYISNDAMDAIWAVEVGTCDPESTSQYWYWMYKDGVSQLAHKSTELCMSSTLTGSLVLTSCELANWRTQFLCAGYFIEHPQTEECVAVRNNVMNGMETLLEELENALESQVIVEEGQVSGALIVEDCNITNSRQKWTIYETDSTICNHNYEHKEHKCYNESLTDAQDWLRCKEHGYFVAGIHYYRKTTLVVSGILCCQSPYSYWNNQVDPVMHSTITCTHQVQWSSATATKFECENDQYLRGLKLKKMTSQPNYFSYISLFECCQPERHKRVYRHCSVNYNRNQCSSSGYYVSSLIEKLDPDGNCSRELKCCV